MVCGNRIPFAADVGSGHEHGAASRDGLAVVTARDTKIHR